MYEQCNCGTLSLFERHLLYSVSARCTGNNKLYILDPLYYSITSIRILVLVHASKIKAYLACKKGNKLGLPHHICCISTTAKQSNPYDRHPSIHPSTVCSVDQPTDTQIKKSPSHHVADDDEQTNGNRNTATTFTRTRRAATRS